VCSQCGYRVGYVWPICAYRVQRPGDVHGVVWNVLSKPASESPAAVQNLSLKETQLFILWMRVFLGVVFDPLRLTPAPRLTFVPVLDRQKFEFLISQ
jgi:hypothetical protein